VENAVNVVKSFYSIKVKANEEWKQQKMNVRCSKLKPLTSVLCSRRRNVLKDPEDGPRTKT